MRVHTTLLSLSRTCTQLSCRAAKVIREAALFSPKTCGSFGLTDATCSGADGEGEVVSSGGGAGGVPATADAAGCCAAADAGVLAGISGGLGAGVGITAPASGEAADGALVDEGLADEGLADEALAVVAV